MATECTSPDRLLFYDLPHQTLSPRRERDRTYLKPLNLAATPMTLDHGGRGGLRGRLKTTAPPPWPRTPARAHPRLNGRDPM